jgi:cyclopropane fatty-acyl-phospholipid synthase-like methyltransferase
MTIWDKIYQKYQKNGVAYASLKSGLMPEFINFVETNTFPIKKVLDIGCGTGKYLMFLKEKGFETGGIDSSPTAVEITKKNLRDNSDIRCIDMYEYALPIATYDLVISIATIHHGYKKQIRDLIKRLYLSLVDDGHFFITLPDNNGSLNWVMMANNKEIEPGTRIPLSGPEKGLPHSSFTQEEIYEIFTDFKDVRTELLTSNSRWVITGSK